MKAALTLIAGFGMTVLFSGCGTVSPVTAAPGREINLQKYQRVLVLDFTDEVSTQVKPAARERKKAELAVATKSFADRIAIEVGALKGFREVVRSGGADGETLVISGGITRYQEGDMTLRLMIGLGAGSAYFDAHVELKDGATNEVLANQKIDQNSWAGGGGYAAAQTPEMFMQIAAKKLAEGITSLKLTGKLPAPKPAPPTTRK